jgi:anti-sigma28 factor (negative regulator of flagellin synthesis)
VTQKVKEAEPARTKSKGKAKAKVNEETMEEVRKEKVERLKAEIVVLQEIVDKLES